LVVDGPAADAFAAASRFFVAAVGAVPGDAWDSVGLGDWTVLELVGHANRAHNTLEDYLLRPRPPEPAGSDYFSPEAIAERGRQAVEDLGADPTGAVGATSERVIALVRGTAPEAEVVGPAGATTLAIYLPTRVAELTIHGLDILRAIGAEMPVPPEALSESLRYVAARAVQQGNGAVALLALSGRSTLSPGFSVF
jgi:uncharacterized protein (TIGR03083 family)